MLKFKFNDFFFRWNLIQIPTNLKMSQNNKKKSGKTFSQLTNIKYEFFFSLTFESNFLQMVTSVTNESRAHKSMLAEVLFF